MRGLTLRAMANRLATSNSPYLLQHADNPVDWYPWGDEAFEKARSEDKPVFLSIGYATCHWCHVMEHESFEDAAVAQLMNEAFVSIKVDREERPDIDGIYMAVAQALTGRGGWPLTVLLTPEGKPFFAGTYFPRASGHGQIGMLDLVPRIQALWHERRGEVDRSAEKLTAAVQEFTTVHETGETLDEASLDLAYKQLRARFDAEWGGFGSAPKFPTPHTLLFLLRYWRRTGDGQALGMVEKTLRALRRGGIWDHVGFGFHRYSTDAHWLLPHFEKMLYDQALLLLAYTEAHQATADPFYRSVAERIAEYVRRDLTNPEGAFYSAEDADSLNREGEKEEGAFYTWTEADLRKTLGEEAFGLAHEVFGVAPEGNVEDEATRRKTGQNVLYHPEPLLALAESLGEGEGALRERIEHLRRSLFDARQERPRPLLDDKVLTDWNGLMIGALARAARAFGEQAYADQAARAADFLLETLWDEEQEQLLHRYRNGEAGIEGHLDDYAFLCWGLFELYEATYEERYLQTAIALHRVMRARFSDPDEAGYFFTAEGGEALLLRRKEFYDGALPSGNSVAMLNGLRLGRLTGDEEWEREAECVGAASSDIATQPAAHTFMMTAVDFAVGPTQEVVIAGNKEWDTTRTMVERLGRAYAPNTVSVLRAPATGDAPISEIVPFVAHNEASGDEAVAYVCERHTCQAPTTDPDEALRLVLR